MAGAAAAQRSTASGKTAAALLKSLRACSTSQGVVSHTPYQVYEYSFHIILRYVSPPSPQRTPPPPPTYIVSPSLFPAK